MSKVIPFRKKTTPANRSPETNSMIKMKDCHFEDNGIGMLLGEGVEVDMDSTTFLNNGAAIVAGSIDDQMLKLLADSLPSERFGFAADLDRISKIPNKEQRIQEIEKSSLASKLSSVANLATVTTWLNDVVEGVSNVDFESVLNTIMGA
jgi:hypothetical protein